MLTHCPHCQTTFRVTTEQLKVRHGQVRCGECREVFDALDSLVDEASVVIRHPAAPPGVDLLLEPVVEAEVDPETRRSQGGEQLPDLNEEPVAIPEQPPAPEPPAFEPSLVEITAAPAAPEASERPASPEPMALPPAPPEPMPAAWEAVPVPLPPRRWPWVAGIVALLVLAIGQALYLFRVPLAIAAPEIRPLLVAGCELFGCTLPRPRKPELVGIEASDLAPAGDLLLLTATLKNRAAFEQEYPHLELTLTDTQDLALISKVLAPADYLPEGQAAAPGFAAHGEVQIKLRLEAAGVPAVGYRLYLFYP